MSDSSGRPAGDKLRGGLTRETTAGSYIGRQPTTMEKIKDAVWPYWAKNNIKRKRTWKTYFRCMVVLLASLIILVDQKTLNFLGQAGFFGLIVAFMLPPSMALSLYAFASLTFVIGSLLGWGWGVAAMAAGTRARDPARLAQQRQAVQAGFNNYTSPALQTQIAVYHGAFLDPRTSTVYGVFMFFGSYFFGLVRAYRPRLILFSMFGTIIMDLMLSYGPLFPSNQFTIARFLLVPSGIYLCISLASTLLIFPQSLSHIFLTQFVDANLKPIQEIFALQEKVLETPPSDRATLAELAQAVKKYRSTHVLSANGLAGQLSLLQLEVTRCQFGPADIAQVFKSTKALASRAFGLGTFALIRHEDQRTFLRESHRDESHRNVRLRQHLEAFQKHQHPGTATEEILPILASSTADLRTTTQRALNEAVAWIDHVNHSRWRTRQTQSDLASREVDLKALKASLAEFRATKQFAIMQPFRSLFDAEGNLKPESQKSVYWSSPALFRCSVFNSSLLAFSAAVADLLELLIAIERRTPKAKIQLPTAFAKMLLKSANDKSASANPLDLGVAEQDDQSDDLHDESSIGDSDSEHAPTKGYIAKNKKSRRAKRVYASDPDAGPPTNIFQRFGLKIHAFNKFVMSPEGIFALKYGIVSIALWCPQVIPSSSWFTYHNRGLWALIMAQTGLGVYAGEQIGSFLIRIAGTGCGLVCGMIVWYIGAPGQGNGNPYGIVAASMVFCAPFMLMRIMAPLEESAFWLMSGVTVVFTVGYSWLDTHMVLAANSGKGAGLAGRRALLVIIGFAAAFLVMWFPRPISAKKMVRRGVAKNLAATGNLYVLVLSKLEEEVELDLEGKARHRVDSQARIDKLRGPFLKVMSKMQALDEQLEYASLEPGLRGPWPKKKYEALQQAQSHLLSALILLAASYARLEPQWCRRLERVDHMRPAFVADCLALFSLLEQSLLTGRPLPPTMFIFERLAYHSQYRVLPSRGFESEKSESAGDAESTVSDTESVHDVGVESVEARENDRALRVINEPITWSLCHDEQMIVFASAVVALTHVANALNELQNGVIALVGAREATELERAQVRWGQVESAVL